MRMFRFFKLYLTNISILLSSTLSHVLAVQNYYIAPDGANSNAGSINSPWRSLDYAVRVARTGDSIIMRGGIYNMGELLIDSRKGMGGRPGQYLTIKAFNGEEPILRGRRRLIVHANYVRLEGLHFVMPWRCEAFGRGIQIVNNKFTGPQPKFGAIETGGLDILIEGNVIRYHGSDGGTQDHGIYVHKSERITLRNNTIIGSKGYGIHVYDEHKSVNPSSWAAHPFVMKDYLIEGNFVANSRERSGMVIGKGRGGNFITLENIIVRNNVFARNKEFGLLIREGRNITVLNNTFYFNKLASILIRYPSEGLKPVSQVTIKNNIFVSHGRGHVGNTSNGDDITLENNLYNSEPRLKGIVDPNPIVGDPHFVDVTSDDFRLQPSSQAIDVGIYEGLPFNGSAPDLGAFEFYDSYNDILSEEAPPAEATSTIAASVSEEITSFQAFVVSNYVILNWKVSSNSSLLGFEVQRGGDSDSFSEVAFIETLTSDSLSQSYQYLDEEVDAGVYFYRLKHRARDGTFAFSSVIKVEIGAP